MSNETGENVAFDYIKSHYFRVIHADGAIGSVTPSGLLHFALYSERPAIPRRIVHSVSEGGRLGTQIEDLTESRESVVREMDVDVIMSVDGAKALRDWLDKLIASRESAISGNGD